ncbi:MAG: hypothetical protein AAB074_09255 [Planctomycetota bacterium]
MIEAAGLAFPRAPLDAALARLAPGSLFDALVVASSAPGKFRLSVLGASLDLETALALEVGERVRLAVKSTEPLTLEIRPAVSKPEEGQAGPRALSPDVEAAVRAFAGGDAAREAAARFLAARGLGLDPAAARGLAALLRSPAAEGAALSAARKASSSDALANFRNTLDLMIGPAPDRGALLAKLQAAIGGGDAGLNSIRANFVAEAAVGVLRGNPAFEALVEASLQGPEAARVAAAALNSRPEAGEATGLLDSARALGDIGRALRVLNADAASRGDGVVWFALGWVRDGRPEGGFGRVESRTGGAADPSAPARVVVTLELTRLGLVQIVIALAAGAASVSLAASAPSRRLLERDRAGLLEALVRLGLRADVRFSEGPLEPVLPLPAGGLDVRA